jgi:hypothetical protein
MGEVIRDTPGQITLPQQRDVQSATAWLSYLTSIRFHILLLCLLIGIAFGNSLRGEFLYDDHRVVLNNPLFGHWDVSTLRSIMTHDYWAALSPENADGAPDSLYYRPFYHIFENLTYALMGKSAVLWHLVSLLLHLGGTLAGYFLIIRIIAAASDLGPIERRLAALLGAAVFAVHPVQSETVAWVSAQGNSIVAICLFSAFLCYLQQRESRRRWLWQLAAMALFLTAALTKENGLCLPLIIGAYELFASRQHNWVKRLRSSLIKLLPFAIATAIYFVLRYNALHLMFGQFGNDDFPDDGLLTTADRLRTVPLVIWEYVKLAIAPIHLALMYPTGIVRTAGLTSFWLPLLAVLIFIGLGVFAALRVPETRFALIWIVVPLLPHLALRSFVSEELVHDRFLYISLIGLGWFVALLARRFVMRSKSELRLALVAIGAIVLVAGFSAMSYLQNRQWLSDEALWNWSRDRSPESRIVHLALGQLDESKGDMQSALAEYNAALKVNPNVVDALNNSAFVLARLGRWQESASRLESVAALTPNKAIAHSNLAFVYGVLGRYADALPELQRAIELAPSSPLANQWRVQADHLKRAGPLPGKNP